MALAAAKTTATVEKDLESWVRGITNPTLRGLSPTDQFVFLALRHAEFRSLLNVRVRRAPLPLRLMVRILYPPLPTLRIFATEIGEGFFIQNGASTAIDAVRIGKNFWINQQVTIGHTSGGCPTIGDNVRVACGAKVLGPIELKDGATVGANALVVESIEAGVTVVAPKAVELTRSRVN
ncbi:serine acetyltransferase [Rhodococcus sp. GG48]|nr:serine acetyltransferase [Rhodococcus sp. GG48]